MCQADLLNRLFQFYSRFVGLPFRRLCGIHTVDASNNMGGGSMGGARKERGRGEITKLTEGH